jgi:hypothetical protein
MFYLANIKYLVVNPGFPLLENSNKLQLCSLNETFYDELITLTNLRQAIIDGKLKIQVWYFYKI